MPSKEHTVPIQRLRERIAKAEADLSLPLALASDIEQLLVAVRSHRDNDLRVAVAHRQRALGDVSAEVTRSADRLEYLQDEIDRLRVEQMLAHEASKELICDHKRLTAQWSEKITAIRVKCDTATARLSAELKRLKTSDHRRKIKRLNDDRRRLADKLARAASREAREKARIEAAEYPEVLLPPSRDRVGS